MLLRLLAAAAEIERMQAETVRTTGFRLRHHVDRVRPIVNYGSGHDSNRGFEVKILLVRRQVGDFRLRNGIAEDLPCRVPEGPACLRRIGIEGV